MSKKKTSRRQSAKTAGEQYANDQINGEHFMDWVFDQLVEASKMDPSKVHPIETLDDAKKIARNMLQQLEWDTKRGLERIEIERMIGGNLTRDRIEEFYSGFKRASDASRDWLAEEVLRMHRSLRGGKSVDDAGRSVDRTAWYIDAYKGEEIIHTSGPYASKSEAVQAMRRRRDLSWGDPYQGMDMGHAPAPEPSGLRANESHRVADFNTLEDLLEHARKEGATHVIKGHKSWDDPYSYIYFPSGNRIRPYTEARVFHEHGYWHTEAPGARAMIVTLPPNADPIAERRTPRRGVREAREAPRGRRATGGRQATKPGNHGTLKLWTLTYTDGNNPAFGESSIRTWAYDREAAALAFNDQTESDGESWEIVKIEPVLDTGPKRLSRETRETPIDQFQLSGGRWLINKYGLSKSEAARIVAGARRNLGSALS